MRSWITGQNSDMHAHPVFRQTEEPVHRVASEVCAARRGIDAGADPDAHDAARTVHEVAVQTRVMIRVFLKHMYGAHRRFVSASARRNRAIGHDLLSDHEVSPLFRN